MVVSLLISEVLRAVDRILEGVRFKKIKKQTRKKQKQPCSDFRLLLITFQYTAAESNLEDDME